MPMAKLSPRKRKQQMTSILPDALDIIDEASEESSVATSLTIRSSNKSPTRSIRENSPEPQSPIILEANLSKTRARRSVPISPVPSPGSETKRNIISVPFSSSSVEDIAVETVKHSNTRTQREQRHSSPVRGEIIAMSEETYQSSNDDELLAWRMTPVDALSDWTIRVTNKDDQSIHNYHVRKSVLATGIRRSEYFVQVFQRHTSKTNSVTDVGFSTAAIRAMPHVLDYMYSTKPPKISSEWAMGMRFLAQFFGLKLLFKTVMDFIQKDLSMSTILPYCRDSINLKDEKMMGVSARHIGRNILQLPEDHPVLNLIDPPFVLEIVSVTGFESEGRDLHKAKVVAAYLEKRRYDMDENTFLALTTEDVLPVFYPNTALSLLGLEADIVKSLKGSNALTALEMRCIRDLAPHLPELSEADPEQSTAIMNNLPPRVVSKLLNQSLSSAKKLSSKHKGSTFESSKYSESPTMTPKMLKVKMTRSLLKGLSSPGRLFVRENSSPDNPGKTVLRVSPRRSQSPHNKESPKKDTKDSNVDTKEGQRVPIHGRVTRIAKVDIRVIATKIERVAIRAPTTRIARVDMSLRLEGHSRLQAIAMYRGEMDPNALRPKKILYPVVHWDPKAHPREIKHLRHLPGFVKLFLEVWEARADRYF
ncbi:hypothetical protein FisN_1Lh116 [Fistulifera solaris]|uniref:BTB domain-containing protein n=1 Tax=Fistulifera solaris TaxID=1519565 RepID=A0A1Z5K4Z8_FISSO|nr:hypothetical protein FisN_1Lh116 [Fistulifera solaris]|eukprot:GAX21286.1 hypothetical protein FisN_1Lh116 [Fistulifera solaris]